MICLWICIIPTHPNQEALIRQSPGRSASVCLFQGTSAHITRSRLNQLHGDALTQPELNLVFPPRRQRIENIADVMNSRWGAVSLFWSCKARVHQSCRNARLLPSLAPALRVGEGVGEVHRRASADLRIPPARSDFLTASKRFMRAEGVHWRSSAGLRVTVSF